MSYSYLTKVVKNASFRFVFLKYLSFGILFLNVFILNTKLGLYYFGIYAFYKLILSYSSYSNLGINYALNILPSNKQNVSQKYINDLFTNSFVYNIIFSLLSITIFFYVQKNYAYVEKFKVDEYFWYLAFIYIIRQFNIIFVSYNRLVDNINLLNLNYILPAIIELLLLCFTKTEGWALFINILYFFGLSQFILLVINLFFLIKSNFIPAKIYLNWFFLKKSLHQLIYNLSFYGIWLTTKTVFSKYLTIEDYSEFSFISSVIEALFLSTGAITFLMLPKLLNKIANLKEYKSLLDFNKVYNSTNSLLCVFGLLLIPFLNLFFPEYSQVEEYFCALLLAQFFLNSPFTFNTIFINKGEENILTIIGVLVIVFFISVISISFVTNINLSSSYLLTIVIFSSFIYSSLVKVIAINRYEFSELNMEFFFTEILMVRELSVMMIIFLLSLYNLFNIYFLPLFILIHIAFNYHNIIKITQYIKRLLNDPGLLILKIEN